MKLIWKRNYNIKNRLYIEGLYLNEAGFTTDKNISYDINRRNNCALIKLSKSSDNKVTHNISRSGKVVPTIGVRNKAVESFINENSNMELFVFKGIIVLISKDKTNKNIALCEALILKNKDISSGIKRIFNTLVYMGLLNDCDLINDYINHFGAEYSKEKLVKQIPRKIISKYKQQLRKELKKEDKIKKEGFIKISNGFVLCLIVKDDVIEDTIDIDSPVENEVIEFLSVNYQYFNICLNNVKSYIKNQNNLDLKSYRYTSISNVISLKTKRKSLRILVLVELLLKDNISYINELIMLEFMYIEENYLDNRKQIKTLSPPNIKYLESV